ncbi:uncharacterized protein LOC123559198 isoform X2 [Mercenaria mercenaria]|nr:uncharacterized protein LOC123559198 isoform X2 [Mercenaria mercenaria]
MKYPETAMQLARCCQDVQRRTEAEMNQLQKNNETLLRNKQKTERELEYLKQRTTAKQYKDQLATSKPGIEGNGKYDNTVLKDRMFPVDKLLDRKTDMEEEFKKEKAQLQKEIEELTAKNNSVKDYQTLSHEKFVKRMLDVEEKFVKEKAELQTENEKLVAQKYSLEERIEHLEKSNFDSLARLSEVAADGHVDSSSALTDLRVRNQPTKIGEMYTDIYDNEWIDAFDALMEDDHKEEAAVEILRLMLEDVLEFCECEVRPFVGKTAVELQRILGQYRTSERLVQILEAKTGPKEVDRVETCDMVPGRKKQVHERNSKLETIRKEIGASLASFAQKEFREATFGIEYINNLKPFVVKCLRIGWMMVTQTPPMVLHECPIDADSKFDNNVYKVFTRSGPLVDYVVWPALLLHENGPIIAKGVAEGKKNLDKDWHKKLYLQR